MCVCLASLKTCFNVQALVLIAQLDHSHIKLHIKQTSIHRRCLATDKTHCSANFNDSSSKASSGNLVMVLDTFWLLNNSCFFLRFSRTASSFLRDHGLQYRHYYTLFIPFDMVFLLPPRLHGYLSSHRQ